MKKSSVFETFKENLAVREFPICFDEKQNSPTKVGGMSRGYYE